MNRHERSVAFAKSVADAFQEETGNSAAASIGGLFAYVFASFVDAGCRCGRAWAMCRVYRDGRDIGLGVMCEPCGVKMPLMLDEDIEVSGALQLPERGR